MPDDSLPQCYCHAAYGQYRAATQPGGLCLVCAVIPDLCEAAHRMVAASPEWMAIERERNGEPHA